MRGGRGEEKEEEEGLEDTYSGGILTTHLKGKERERRENGKCENTESEITKVTRERKKREKGDR